MKKNSKFLSKRFCLALLASLLILLTGGGRMTYRLIWAPNFQPKQTVYLYIDRQKDYALLCRQLVDSAGCARLTEFQWLSRLLKYPEHMRTGRYVVEPGMSNLALLNNLRRGQQVATKVTFNNVRLKAELADRISEQLMFGKEELLTLLNDSARCDSLGFTPITIPCLFLPNTYECYWNLSAEQFVRRMKREYDAFWTTERKRLAEEQGLTPIEVSILASIVEEETAVGEEYPLVAGLYLNRLRRGMLLQADPTVKFALGDFSLRRILFEHLEVDSPYNTYKYIGLPPGPLRVPSLRGLNSVLHATKHHYLYMCAKEDFSGRHNFAVTLSEHNRNADRYRAALNRRKIY